MENLINSQNYPEQVLSHTRFEASSVINPAYNAYLNSINLYYFKYGLFPNSLSIEGVESTKVSEYMLNNFKAEITDQYYCKNIYTDEFTHLCDYYFFLYEDLMVYINGNEAVNFMFKNTSEEKVYRLIELLKPLKQEKENNFSKINLIVNSYSGLDISEIKIDLPNVDVQYHYNEDFKAIDELIRSKLNINNGKGLVLLHGKPGTGKTTYIRSLIGCTLKRVIFLPPGMAAYLTQPEFIGFLTKYKNSVLVIEDAETLIADREQKYSPVSALLNVTDGLLSDCLNIQVICSFNTDLNKVDSALLRKGRLIARYEFKELEVDRANKLASHLELNHEFDKPTTLSEIFHLSEIGFDNLKRQTRIGFVA